MAAELYRNFVFIDKLSNGKFRAYHVKRRPAGPRKGKAVKFSWNSFMGNWSINFLKENIDLIIDDPLSYQRGKLSAESDKEFGFGV